MEAVKDCGEIWSRLFDHRPFLNGELKFMLREFEEKRADREITNLFSTIESVTEIKDSQIERTKQLTTSNIPSLIEKINQAIESSKNVLLAEKISEEDTTLETNREERKKSWASFVENVTEKYMRIDNAFEQKEEELKDLYADLEHKLTISTK